MEHDDAEAMPSQKKKIRPAAPTPLFKPLKLSKVDEDFLRTIKIRNDTCITCFGIGCPVCGNTGRM